MCKPITPGERDEWELHLDQDELLYLNRWHRPMSCCATIPTMPH